jgi:hypothetical protein
MIGKDYKIKRDKKGRFAKDKTIIVLSVILVTSALSGVVYSLKKAVDWGNTHEITVQKPVLISTQPVVVITEIEPEIMIPVVKDFENLDTLEQKILNTFGERNFAAMRAVAKCESNMNPEAVNWVTKDVGLYQINWPIWSKTVNKEFGYTLKDMFDVDKNIEVANFIFDKDGDGEGTINPWVAAGTQCFRNEL